MERSFRDILSQFLEEKEAETHSPPSENAPSHENHFHVSEPLWTYFPREKGQNPPRERVLRYKSQVRPKTPSEESPSQEVTSPPPSTPAVEQADVLIPLENLDKDSRVMVGILLDLGALELRSGVSLRQVKKAYRQLAKKFHPDRLPPHMPAREREAAKNAFFKLQKAYDYLCENMVETEPLKDAA